MAVTKGDSLFYFYTNSSLPKVLIKIFREPGLTFFNSQI